MWCWHHIRENLNGLCPACRTPYSADPHAFSAVDRQEIVKKNREKKLKEKQEKKVTEKVTPVGAKPAHSAIDRRHLHNYRVVQRNLVYVLGLPASWGSEELLRRAEYFGQYGKINKVVIHRGHSSNTGGTISAYITFAHKEDAKASIYALDGHCVEDHLLRASFGTTKYCNNFIRNVPCNNPECVYLHELGDDDDRFTKEEIQSGHTKLMPTPGKDQTIVTGNGGPSGTGKRPLGDLKLPAPVFIQDNVPKVQFPTRAASSTAVGNGGGSLGSSLPGLEKDVSSVAEAKETVSSPVMHATTPQPRMEGGVLSVSDNSAPVQSLESQCGSTAQPFQRKSLEVSSCAFCGLSKNAVFPVPTSSLTISIWSSVLGTSNPDLHLNPFEPMLIPFSDLLDLILPPVDCNFMSSSHVKIDSTLTDNLSMKQSMVRSVELNSNASRSGQTGSAGLSQLRQIFPGVNLSYGIVPTQTSGVTLVPSNNPSLIRG